jgi:drug/metabolite transporter (DMT)-like permease
MATLPSPRRGLLFGLGAAVSFGISAPLAKVLLDDVSPQMLAGLLYVGAFVALSLVGRRSRTEAQLRRADAPRLMLMILAGGVIAPVLLLLGLDRVTGVTGSLLLNPVPARHWSPTGPRPAGTVRAGRLRSRARTTAW